MNTAKERKINQKPIDRQAFRDSLAKKNSKRTLPALIVAIVFSGMTSCFHFYDKNYHADPFMRVRSESFFLYGFSFFVLAIIFTVFYIFSVRKNASNRLKMVTAYMFFVWHLAWAVTTPLIMLIMDDVNYSVFYIAFTLFACLIFLIRPLVTITTLAFFAAVSYFSFLLLPGLFNKPELDAYNLSLIWETIFCVFILSLFLSVVMYQNYLRDFNKSFTIESLNNELKDLNEELTWRIKIDPLTELFNRKEFATLLLDESNKLAKENDWISVAILDIDYFKQFNDTYGHIEGDKCLIKIAQTINQSIQELIPNATVARYGGEEFTTFIPRSTPEEALKLLEKVNSDLYDLQIPHSNSSVAPVVTVSTGLYSIKLNDDYDIQKALIHADKLLYDAKDNGRNQIVSEEDDFSA